MEGVEQRSFVVVAFFIRDDPALEYELAYFSLIIEAGVRQARLAIILALEDELRILADKFFDCLQVAIFDELKESIGSLELIRLAVGSKGHEDVFPVDPVNKKQRSPANQRPLQQLIPRNRITLGQLFNLSLYTFDDILNVPIRDDRVLFLIQKSIGFCLFSIVAKLIFEGLRDVLAVFVVDAFVDQYIAFVEAILLVVDQLGVVLFVEGFDVLKDLYVGMSLIDVFGLVGLGNTLYLLYDGVLLLFCLEFIKGWEEAFLILILQFVFIVVHFIDEVSEVVIEIEFLFGGLQGNGLSFGGLWLHIIQWLSIDGPGQRANIRPKNPIISLFLQYLRPLTNMRLRSLPIIILQIEPQLLSSYRERLILSCRFFYLSLALIFFQFIWKLLFILLMLFFDIFYSYIENYSRRFILFQFLSQYSRCFIQKMRFGSIIQDQRFRSLFRRVFSAGILQKKKFFKFFVFYMRQLFYIFLGWVRMVEMRS